MTTMPDQLVRIAPPATNETQPLPPLSAPPAPAPAPRRPGLLDLPTSTLALLSAPWALVVALALVLAGGRVGAAPAAPLVEPTPFLAVRAMHTAPAAPPAPTAAAPTAPSFIQPVDCSVPATPAEAQLCAERIAPPSPPPPARPAAPAPAVVPAAPAAPADLVPMALQGDPVCVQTSPDMCRASKPATKPSAPVVEAPAPAQKAPATP